MLALLVATLTLSGCLRGAEKPRYVQPSGTIAYRPICANFRAPLLGPDIPEEGLIPAFLFGVNGASPEERERLKQGLFANGFSITEGTSTINGTEVSFAVGQGVLKTQERADLLFSVICDLDSEHVHVVHARYNTRAEENRMQ